VNTDTASFLKSKFDNICLILMIVFLVCILVWVDKHGNGDFEKWLQTFATGFAGAYLGLLTAARQAWKSNNAPAPSDSAPPVQTSAIAPGPVAGWPGGPKPAP
jgi:hypothetical protein